MALHNFLNIVALIKFLFTPSLTNRVPPSIKAFNIAYVLPPFVSLTFNLSSVDLIFKAFFLHQLLQKFQLFFPMLSVSAIFVVIVFRTSSLLKCSVHIILIIFLQNHFFFSLFFVYLLKCNKTTDACNVDLLVAVNNIYNFERIENVKSLQFKMFKLITHFTTKNNL